MNKLHIAIIHSILAAFLISLMGCSGVDSHEVTESLTIYDGRTLLQYDSTDMCYLPPLNAYLIKFRIGDNQADEWNDVTITDAVLGFGDSPPDYELIHSDIPWWEWDFYKIAYREGYPLSYYFDETQLPASTMCGDWIKGEWVTPYVTIVVDDYGVDPDGRTWIKITIAYRRY